MREHSLYLKDILEAMAAIEKFVAGIELKNGTGPFSDVKTDDRGT